MQNFEKVRRLWTEALASSCEVLAIHVHMAMAMNVNIQSKSYIGMQKQSNSPE